ncbi:ZN865 protein, partial [Urocolius indicus]|nr:ZN865 protein [Urocolius indicus]
CGVCQKSFKQSSHLVQHQLVHSGQRPYECGACGRAYNHVSSLIRHRRCHKDGPVGNGLGGGGGGG